MRRGSWLLLGVLPMALGLNASGEEAVRTLRGEPAAIVEAKAMVVAMGGREIWAAVKSVHFVHEWFVWNRVDSYIEDEILDLTGPRSWVEMRSELDHRIHAYSPEHKYWNVVNGTFSFASDTALADAMERAPFHFCRLAHAIAVSDPYYEVRLGDGEFNGSKRVEFYGPDGVLHAWILLNARKEPLVWATNQYRYTFGPMRRFGNLIVPDWGSTANGAVTYRMISLQGSNESPEPSMFIPPPAYLEEQKRH